MPLAYKGWLNEQAVWRLAVDKERLLCEGCEKKKYPRDARMSRNNPDQSCGRRKERAVTYAG